MSFFVPDFRFVWVVLLFELVLELVVRPTNYRELIHSEKAFAPSTARYMNVFHFLCEATALILYIPEAVCGLMTQQCKSKFLFNASRAPLWATTSIHTRQAMLGRFTVGLVFLRSFGLARHWKQMWLNHTYEGRDEESCTLFSFHRTCEWFQLLIVSLVSHNRYFALTANKQPLFADCCSWIKGERPLKDFL